MSELRGTSRAARPDEDSEIAALVELDTTAHRRPTEVRPPDRKPSHMIAPSAGDLLAEDVASDDPAAGGHTVVAGHDPIVQSQFEPAVPDCYDLDKPLAA